MTNPNKFNIPLYKLIVQWFNGLLPSPGYFGEIRLNVFKWTLNISDGVSWFPAKTDIDDVLRASKVAKSNDYNDLDNKPDLNFQPLDDDLTAIAALSDIFGLLRKTANNTWEVDTTQYVSGTPWVPAISQAIADLVNSSPATLDTLNELAVALGNDPNFATTVTNLIGTKQAGSADLTAIADLTNTFGLLRKTANGSWEIDTTQYVSGTPWVATINAAVTNILGNAPAQLNTLEKLAAAIGNNPGFAEMVLEIYSHKQNELLGTGYVLCNNGEITYDNRVFLTAITKAMIEAVLTGMINSHSHPYSSTDEKVRVDEEATAALLSKFFFQTSGGVIILKMGDIVQNEANPVSGDKVSRALFNKQDASDDLAAIAALTNVFGLLRKTANGAWEIDTNQYVTGTPWIAAINSAINNLVDSSPSTLDTLNELAAALGDDPNFATTITNLIAAKAAKNGSAYESFQASIYRVGNYTFSQNGSGQLEIAKDGSTKKLIWNSDDSLYFNGTILGNEIQAV